MKQNKQLIRCLKKKLYGGRGLFSRTVDYIALRAIVFMGCYMWFSAMVANGVAKAMLSLASTGFIFVGLDLINSLRLDSLIRAERRRVSAAALNDRLLLMTDDERNRLIAEHISKKGKQADRLICSVHRSEGPTPDDMLKAARAARKRFGKGPFPPRGACRSCVGPNNVLCASIIAIYNYSNKNTYVNK